MPARRQGPAEQGLGGCKAPGPLPAGLRAARKTLRGDARWLQSYLLSFISELGDGRSGVCYGLSRVGTTYQKGKVARSDGQPGARAGEAESA